MKIKDLMTSPAHTVGRDTAFKDIADLLRRQRISAVPVVDGGGKLVGVIAEADLNEGRAASTAADLMTSPAVAIGPEALASEGARLLRQTRVKRLPVVDRRGRVVGMVTAGDLLKMFQRSDVELRREIRALLTRVWPDETVEAKVKAGVVTLSGNVASPAEAAVMADVVTTVPGVVGVDNRLRVVRRDRDRGDRESWDVMGKFLPR
ncbi:MAG TPA: CBS domain-containing protein [Candidatus Dormibacteraeota bacterium]